MITHLLVLVANLPHFLPLLLLLSSLDVQTTESVALPIYNSLPDFGLTIQSNGTAVSFDAIGHRPSFTAVEVRHMHSMTCI